MYITCFSIYFKLTVRSSKLWNQTKDTFDTREDDESLSQIKRPNKSSLKRKEKHNKSHRVEFKRSQSQASPSKEVVTIKENCETPTKQKGRKKLFKSFI